MTSVSDAFAATTNTASISGVVAGPDGTPLPGILVLLSAGDYERISTANTDTNGRYSFSGLSSGSYRMLFSPSSYNQKNGTTYAFQRSPYSSTSSSSLITLSDGQSVSINTQLENAGFISGKVYDPNGKPLTGIMVCEVYEGSTYRGNYTNSSGEYIIKQLPAENYQVYFDPAEYNAQYGTDYSEQWYNNKPGSDLADEAAVIQGETFNVDAHLQVSSGTISGFKAEACGNQIRLSWSAFSGAQSYNIYRTSRFFGIRYQNIGTATSTSYTDSDLSLSTNYWYKVKPVTATGEGSFSAPVSTKTASTIITNPDVIISTVAGNGTAGYSGDGGPAISAQLSHPHGVACDGSGNLYIVDNSNNRIRKVDTYGNISTVAGDGTQWFEGDGGPATAAGLYDPIGVACDSSGNFYIADSNHNCIRKVDSSGKISIVAGRSSLGLRYSGDGGPAISAGLNYPFGVVCDGNGNMYIADRGNQRIRKVDSSGIISTVAGNGTEGYSGDGGPAISAQLNDPVGVACDSNGNLYIVDKSNNRIRKVDSSGTISTAAGNGTGGYAGDGGPATSAQIWVPYGVAFDSNGNMYIADMNNKRIRKVDSSGIITTVAGNGSWEYSGDGGPAEAAGLCNAVGVAFDSSGNLYIADSHSNCIRKVVFANNLESIVFADPGLEAAVRETINKPEGPLTAADVENIYELSIFSRGITSLEGIQNLKNLKGLYAWGNPISDISPLEQLPDLQWLDLENTGISNCETLSRLTNLEELCLAYNNLTREALKYLGGLVKITTLNLRGNLLNNNSARSVMSLDSSSPSDLSALSSLTNLVDLDLSDNGITDVGALSSLTRLTELNLSDNQISNLTPIGSLKEIQQIDLSNNQINDISSLSNLDKVQNLDISSNQVDDVTPLSSLNNINTLNLSANSITSVEPLGSLPNLQNVYIGDNNITDLSPLQNLPNIEEFSSDSGNYSPKNWESKINVENKKEWNIRFSFPLDLKSINPQNVYVKDSSGSLVGADVAPGPDNCTIIVKPPASGYAAGKTYNLYISKKIKSAEGKELKEPVIMIFSIADPSTARLEPQGLLDNVFLVKDLVSFGMGMTRLFDANMHYVDYIKQLPQDHYIAKEMDNMYGQLGMDDWRKTAPPGINALYRESISVLYIFDNFFSKDTALKDAASAAKFYNELSGLVSNIANTIYTVNIPWWASDIFRPIKEVNQAVKFMATWNQIRDGQVVLGRNLKLSGDKVYQVGNNANPLKLTMEHKPKWEIKYILGRPSQVIPVAQSEQALWVSENPDVATVYKGKVTSYKPGTATIKVKYYDKTAKIKIQVK